MQRKLLSDGLWRCLCPSFDQFVLRTAIRQSLPRTRPAVSRPCAARSGPIYVRCYGTTAGFASRDEVQPGEDGGRFTSPKLRSWKDRLLASTAPSEETLKASTVEEIFAALNSLREARDQMSTSSPEIDQHQRIVQLVQHLLQVEDQPITPYLYECLMDAMAHPRGSVDGARRLLDDMVEQGMKPTAELCNGALRALMNHPDYILRQEILGIMQEYWFTIDTPVKQTVIVGMLRDEQYELAYARLTELIEQGARIDPWVYDIFILVFGKLRFLDEMLQLLYRRKNIGGSTDPIVITLTLRIRHVQSVIPPCGHFVWVALSRAKSPCATVGWHHRERARDSS